VFLEYPEVLVNLVYPEDPVVLEFLVFLGDLGFLEYLEYLEDPENL
jgi:hypothetical protein